MPNNLQGKFMRKNILSMSISAITSGYSFLPHADLNVSVGQNNIINGHARQRAKDYFSSLGY